MSNNFLKHLSSKLNNIKGGKSSKEHIKPLEQTTSLSSKLIVPGGIQCQTKFGLVVESLARVIREEQVQDAIVKVALDLQQASHLILTESVGINIIGSIFPLPIFERLENGQASVYPKQQSPSSMPK